MQFPTSRRSLRSRLAARKEETLFQLRRPKWDSVISDELPFDLDATLLFESELRRACSYLEYGAGSSTLSAVARVPRVVSVESDHAFMTAVQRRCDGCHAAADLIYVDIGATGPWGTPVFKSRIWRQSNRWNAYPLAPWQRLGDDYRADLILIDGRFRVACALATISRQPDTQWSMLVDDYVDRPEYHILERFARLVEVRGRMAAFAPSPALDPAAAEDARRRFMVDWR